MAKFNQTSLGKFQYKDLEQLEADLQELHLSIQISDDLSVLGRPISLKNHVIPNSLATLPMEGGDADANGSPTEMTLRKYEKIARGGAGLIWVEAVSVTKDGRSNDKQLWLKEDNWEDFKALNDLIKKTARETYGPDFNPITIIQLNHSGRYHKVNGKPSPVIATRKQRLDDRLGIDHTHPLVTDDYLDELQATFLSAARLSRKAGFDGVDIKACHGYLLCELLSAFERDGRYGGSFENRTRMMLDVVDAVKKDAQCEGLILATRMNIYDAQPYPQGWGVSEASGSDIDLTEPKQLMQLLLDRGVEIFGLTMGNPYFIPHINKPYDMGAYVPDEMAIESCERLIREIGSIQQDFPQAVVVGVGYSWFRQFAAQVAAGSVSQGLCRMAGFGREAIAYPDFARDALTHQALDRTKVCISCSKCSELKSKIGTCGCVVRDADVYLPLYKELKAKEASAQAGETAGQPDTGSQTASKEVR
ncbi:flavin oxidoreductase/NADH oxidase [Anoxynatronum buryatiense]|uniref:2,4-dienoyl-CoA reductase n=1 Tax=Anoxynatronum buryatiense TaxID=489973 RepID=A0AA45WVC7_9CLOT|nr:flavin oxidoreductase/NADH oxidase [Anoxynatronum buryatiense]SMP51204.1 2,4-dienoyl-CoA reductase [Anoxynatronum buryatiense]